MVMLAKLPPAPPGTAAGSSATYDPTQPGGYAWEAGTKIATAVAIKSSGVQTTVSTSYVAIDGTGAFDLTVPAAAGDVLQLSAKLFTQESLGNAAVSYMPYTMNGNTQINPVSPVAGGFWRYQDISAGWETVGTPGLYTVVAGDIIGGNVTLRLFWKVSSGTGTLASDGATADVQWSVLNLKH